MRKDLLHDSRRRARQLPHSQNGNAPLPPIDSVWHRGRTVGASDGQACDLMPPCSVRRATRFGRVVACGRGAFAPNRAHRTRRPQGRTARRNWARRRGGAGAADRFVITCGLVPYKSPLEDERRSRGTCQVLTRRTIALAIPQGTGARQRTTNITKSRIQIKSCTESLRINGVLNARNTKGRAHGTSSGADCRV